ncbi:hypothetical protein C8Q76DRAFT_191505 [Earliella scabrosa]|nr:hypothetical protein C8Q76DRAFT_191505 [Earliella scabrosa]
MLPTPSLPVRSPAQWHASIGRCLSSRRAQNLHIRKPDRLSRPPRSAVGSRT